MAGSQVAREMEGGRGASMVASRVAGRAVPEVEEAGFRSSIRRNGSGPLLAYHR